MIHAITIFRATSIQLKRITLWALSIGILVFTVPAQGYQGPGDNDHSNSDLVTYRLETVRTYQVPDGLFNDVREYVFVCMDAESITLINRASNKLIILKNDTTLISHIQLEVTNGDNLTVIGAVRYSPDELILADYIGGTVNILDINTCVITERIQTPLSSISSIVSSDDGDIIVSGTFRNRRIHTVQLSGRVSKSVNQDLNYTTDRPAFAIGGDKVISAFGSVYYYHPARFEVTVYNDGIRQDRTYEFQGMQKYISPYTFDRDQYSTQKEAKNAFSRHFTPLKGIYPFQDGRDMYLLSALKLITGQYWYDVWKLDSSANHIGSVDLPNCQIIGISDGTLIVVSEVEENSTIRLLVILIE